MRAGQSLKPRLMAIYRGRRASRAASLQAAAGANGDGEMLEAAFAVFMFVGIYIILWYLFSKDSGGGVG